MIVHDLVPAGWLGAPDLTSKVADALHKIADNDIPGEVAFATSALLLADALSLARPGLAAFVRDGDLFMVPGFTWGRAIDDHLLGGDALTSTFATGRCSGEAFDVYEGRQLLFSYAETMVWLNLLSSVASPVGVQAAAPWGDIRNRTRWLGSQAATAFADARLLAAGKPVNEKARRHEFEAAFANAKAIMPITSITGIRDRSGWKIGPRT